MSPSPQKRDAQTPPNKTASLLLGDIADTTWRMFVPTIGLTVLGLIADKSLHTTPWMMVIGIVVGAAIAIGLVRRQLQKVNSQ